MFCISCAMILHLIIYYLLNSQVSGAFVSSTWRHLVLKRDTTNLTLNTEGFTKKIQAGLNCLRQSHCALVCQDAAYYYTSNFNVPFDFYEPESTPSLIFHCWSNQPCKYSSAKEIINSLYFLYCDK